jgi:hypothetical protein
MKHILEYADRHGGQFSLTYDPSRPKVWVGKIHTDHDALFSRGDTQDEVIRTLSEYAAAQNLRRAG